MTPLHELSAEEFERLLARSEREPSASAELDFQADLQAAAELERSALEAALVRRGHRLASRPWLWAAAAAAMLVVSGLALWLAPGRGEPARARDLARCGPPHYIAAELRSPDASAQDDLARAMEPYARGEYPAAARALAALLDEHPQHGPARFYLAAAREQLGELEAAEDDYRRVAAEAEGFLAEHASWRLANLLLARDHVERARAELERLRATEGAFARNAGQLLERLARVRVGR